LAAGFFAAGFLAVDLGADFALGLVEGLAAVLVLVSRYFHRLEEERKNKQK
jgi:hypothetical protein